MSASTKIEWCDSTWNPITGCTPISAGCANCYARKMAHRFHRDWTPGTSQKCMDLPRTWKKPRRIFVCSTGDLFHEKVDAGYIQDAFRVIDETPRHTFMVLTKRPGSMEFFINEYWQKKMAPSNLWVGTTIENQAVAKDRLAPLMRTRARVHFISVEPMLSEVDLRILPCPSCNSEDDVLSWPCQRCKGFRFIVPEMVICGAETGQGKRPCKKEWIDFLRKQCRVAGVKFFGKKDSDGEPIEPKQMVDA